MKFKPTVYEAMRDGLIRTYGDLTRIARPSSSRGNCCACHRYDRPTWQLSTRASICDECCKRKADEVLGRILTSERKARRYARDLIKRNDDIERAAKFYSSLAGVSESFFRNAYAAERAKVTPDQLSDSRS